MKELNLSGTVRAASLRSILLTATALCLAGSLASPAWSDTAASGTTVSGNVLAVTSPSDVADAEPGASLTLAAGTLRALAPLTLVEPVALASGGGTFDTNGNNVTLSGTVSDFKGLSLSPGPQTGPLVKTGLGTLTLSGANLYTGLTIVNQGALSISSPDNFNDSHTFTGLLFDGGTLQTTASMTLAEPIAINASGGTFDTAGNNVVVTTAIGDGTGPGSLGKIGNGLLTLDGQNTYSGGTTVSGGMLQVGDAAHPLASLAGSVAVQSGGMLLGNGAITGNVASSGVVQPGAGFSVGTLSVNGNYTQGALGTLAVAVTPQSASLLSVGGSATIGGTILVTPAAGAYATGRIYPVLTAGSGVAGTFASTEVASNANVFFLAQYLPNQVDLLTVAPQNPTSNTPVSGEPASVSAGTTATPTASGAITGLQGVQALVRQAFAQGGLTPDESNIAGAIASIVPSTTSNMLRGLLPIVASGNAAQRTALDGLAGELRADIATIDLANLTSFQNFIVQRMDHRQGVSGGTEANTGLPGTFDVAMNDTDLPLFGTGGEPAIVTADQPSVWVHGYGVLGEAGGETGFANFQYGTGGIVAGVDAKVTDSTLVGAAIGYEHTDFNLSGVSGEGNDIDTYRLTAYASQNLQPVPLVLDAAVGYAFNQYRDNEFATTSAATVVQDSRHSGDEVTAEAGLSHGFDVRQDLVDGALRIAPRVGVEYDNISQSSYSTGGSPATGLNLVVNRDTLNALRSTAGARATLKVTTGNGTVLTPELRASYLHDFMDVNQPLTENFVGAPAAGFRISGVHPGRDAALAGAGLTAAFPGNLTASIGYDAAVRTHELDHTVEVGVKISW